MISHVFYTFFEPDCMTEQKIPSFQCVWTYFPALNATLSHSFYKKREKNVPTDDNEIQNRQ